MTIPGFQDVMLPVLQATSAGDESRTGDLVRRMEDQFQLTAEERSALLPSGRQSIIANRTHWAITYLAKTGLLERTRRGLCGSPIGDAPCSSNALLGSIWNFLRGTRNSTPSGALGGMASNRATVSRRSYSGQAKLPRTN